MSAKSSEKGSAEDWFSVNQRLLMTELGRLRTVLASRLKTTGVDAPAQTSPPDEPLAQNDTRTSGPSSAMDAIVGAFGLSQFERDLLLLCAGPDLDAKFATLLAQLHGDARRTAPTFGLALGALSNAHWSALSPAAPLRRWRLVELGPGDSLTTSVLRVDEWTLHFLTGVPHLDERLQPLVRVVPPIAALTPSQRKLAERLTRLCNTRAAQGGPPLIQLCGDDPDSALVIARHAAERMGCKLFRLCANDAPASPAERETFARVFEREAALCGSVLLVDFRDAEHGETARAALALLESVGSLVVVLAREPVRGLNRGNWRIDVPRPSAREQHGLWGEALGPKAAALNGQLQTVAGQFCLSAREIVEVATVLRTAERDAEQGASEVNCAALWFLCRAQSRARLESLAQRIEPAATWEDLVLPVPQRNTLREIAAHVRQRFLVYEQWGFAGKGTRGLGISVLFTGTSGTGKTMAAEVLANELNLDLFRIDLSAVVNKYIGETEKNLRHVFDAAEAGGAILLFDEADTLFGKRSEVKDSHDRYANIEIGYLLQRMEAYRGLAILTTNFKQALDPAFLRRLRFAVTFPFPDATQRAEIWRSIFPVATPTEGLNLDKLARLNVAGGNIRNIALHAAFHAAEEGEPVRMKHLLQAARSECAKLERPSSEVEIGDWLS